VNSSTSPPLRRSLRPPWGTLTSTTNWLSSAGLAEEEAIRVWVLVHEIAEGFWGAGGQIIHFEQLRAAAKAERDKAAAPA